MSSTRLRRVHIGAIWMRAVANACGYTPELAKPLGLAYSMARTTKRKLYEKYVCGDLEFAGLRFLEPAEDVVHSMGQNLLAIDYEQNVTHRFETPAKHLDLFYVAVDSAETYTLEELDQTDIAWKRLKAAFGLRTSFSSVSALELFNAVKKK